MASDVQRFFRIRTTAIRFIAIAWISILASSVVHADVSDQFQTQVRPLIAGHCMECHSTEKVAGELDLEPFVTVADAKKNLVVWENMAAQITDGEMPPKDRPPLSQSDQTLLLDWIKRFLDEAALASAGDPGPVSLRRLSNAE